MSNRLADETSPYLQQHAHNPVDWYPWGPEALARARVEDRPILLSIGYAACHWCHVMERESFEDPAIAAMMNDRFVNIKVDREERPDLDSIYMRAVQALSGQGGWPMTVFLTPDLKPFHGGTYFPPEDRGAMPGLPRVLAAVSDAYRDRRGQVTETAERLGAQLRQDPTSGGPGSPLSPVLLDEAFAALSSGLDGTNGGFGGAPKFPQPSAIEYLLRHAHRTGDPSATAMASLTLDRMARGGIYDQLGGGFHRYATDPEWLVPHFEKMLYDNALLVRLYLHGYQATGRAVFRRVAVETVDYVLRDLRDPAGGFYTSRDADSEGREGLFYIWSQAEVTDLLGPDDGALFSRLYGITPQDGFEGRSILHLPEAAEDVAAALGMPLDELEARVARGSALLLAARDDRAPPARDDKVLTAWNGLMLGALAEAAAVLGRPDYLRAAEANAAFLLHSLREDGRLLRTWRDGRAKLKGYLEDHAFLIDGLIALYETSFDLRWLQEARALADTMLDLFWDPSSEGFFDTGTDHEELLTRPRDVTDGAMPSGASAATLALLRLGALTGVSRYRAPAIAALEGIAPLLGRHAIGLGHWLCALDFALSSPKEVVIVGGRGEPDTAALLSALHGAYLPNKVVAGLESEDDPAAEDLALLEGRHRVGGRATAYVCQNFACRMPVTEAEALLSQLAGEDAGALGGGLVLLS